MKSKKGSKNMIIPTIVMAIIAITLLYIGFKRGDSSHITGLKISGTMLIEIIPLLICAFIIAGMTQILIPRESISEWIGEGSGFKGILLGSIAGGLTPGGPFMCLPLAAGLYKAGASIGTMVAYMTGWSLWSVMRLPMEVGILGWKLTIVRFTSTLIFPPIAGLIAKTFWGK